MLIKREVFINVGGFDPDFFAHMEEIDLCWRIRRSGLKLLVVPDSHVYHVGGGTLPNESSAKLYLNFRNNLFLLYKNLPDRKLTSIIFIRLLLDGVAAIKYLLGGKFGFVTAIFKAHMSFFQSLSSLKKKRSANSAYINSTAIGLYSESIVAKHYLNGVKKFSDLDFKQSEL